jgi:hypothetical protein
MANGHVVPAEGVERTCHCPPARQHNSLSKKQQCHVLPLLQPDAMLLLLLLMLVQASMYTRDAS